MPNLAELQKLMHGNNKDDAIAAGNALANYYFIYNEEFNTLIKKRQEASSALYDATHNPAGANPAEVLHLQALSLWAESRMRLQDAKLLAFSASTLTIFEPDPILVAEVKNLAAKVSAMQARAQGIDNILQGLAAIAALIDKVQSGPA